MTKESDVCKLEVHKFITESEKAVKVSFTNVDNIGDSAWIPLSQISEIHREANKTGYIIAKKWILKKIGAYIE